MNSIAALEQTMNATFCIFADSQSELYSLCNTIHFWYYVISLCSLKVKILYFSIKSFAFKQI